MLLSLFSKKKNPILLGGPIFKLLFNKMCNIVLYNFPILNDSSMVINISWNCGTITIFNFRIHFRFILIKFQGDTEITNNPIDNYIV